MAFSERLATRVRRAMAEEPGVSEKRMFGGLCFLVHGNLCCGVDADQLFVRTGPEAAERLLRRKHAQPFAPSGRPMKGWVIVDPSGVSNRRSLESWLHPALSFAHSLPRKPGAHGKRR